MFSVHEILDIAIRIEKNGEKFYREAREEVSSDSVASLLQWLADAEVEHWQGFTDLKESLNADVGNRQLEEMSGALLQDILGDQNFSLSDIDLTDVHGVATLFQLAIEFENDTILFFEMISGLIDDSETLACLETIIREERHHIEVLQEFPEKEGDGSKTKGTQE
jgi:rubrerythrin